MCINLNVSIGAAYQAASIKEFLNNEIHKQIILIDIVGNSIRIDKNGKMQKIVAIQHKIQIRKQFVLIMKKIEKI